MRIFIRSLLVWLVPLAGLAPLAAGGAAYLDLGPMVGHVSTTNARIWFKASEATRPVLELADSPNFTRPRSFQGARLQSGADFMATMEATGLQAGTRYFYRLRFDSREVMARPYPAFVTAPAAPGKIRFAFTSCNGKHGFDAAAAWADLAARTNVDFLLMLGDNHYADTTERTKQRAAYYSHRRVAGFRELVQRTPTYAIWDDHDYGPNDGDATTAGREISLETFKQFWANPAYGEPHNPGVYFEFQHGGIDFFLLDVRYYRSPNKAVDQGAKTMLGPIQREWIKRRLLASKAPLKFVASGSEWQPKGHTDSWTSFERERNELFDFIETNRVAGVIFLSGDRHFTAGYQIRGKWIEITSGPVGSSNARIERAPEMFLLQDQGKLYCVFEVSPGTQPTATLEVYRTAQGLVERRAFSWEEIMGQRPISP